MNIFPNIQGKVDDWDVIVCGHLRWNRFFGESEARRTRGFPSTCGSALIRGKLPDGSVYRLLVDPTLRASAAEMEFELNRRTGLHLKDVTHTFSSHHHGDHTQGARYFPNATWFAPAAVIPRVEDADIAAKMVAADGEFLPGVAVVPLPGHTKELCGVGFAYAGKKILIAGDAIMTRQHFLTRATEFQPDPVYVRKAAETIDNIAESFDIALPGHDNPIVI